MCTCRTCEPAGCCNKESKPQESKTCADGYDFSKCGLERKNSFAFGCAIFYTGQFIKPCQIARISRAHGLVAFVIFQVIVAVRKAQAALEHISHITT